MNEHKRPLTKVLFLILSLIFAWLIPAAPASAQLFTLNRTFDDPTMPSYDQFFGRSVALDGNWALIGAPGDTLEVGGKAHLFDVTTGNLVWTFSDPFYNEGDVFGHSVALHGNWALIGDPYDDTHGVSVGQAHLFDITTGNLSHTFDDPTGTFIEYFGYSVAIDGAHILIGAPQGDNGEKAHLFDIAGNLLHTFEWAGHDLGWRVALDGEHVLLGDLAQAHLFDLAGNLLHTFYDPNGLLDGYFGYSVALHGDRVLIGDAHAEIKGQRVGQAHLFDTSGNLLWTFNDPTPAEYDSFGYHLALDANHILISAGGDDTNGENVGQAHLFDATTFDLLHTFDDPTPTEYDAFSPVALDGNRFLIGAPRDDTNGNDVGQAYLFTPSCDFNSDAQCDIDDLNSMLAEGPIAPGVAVTPGVNDQFDLTGDGVIDLADLDQWLADAAAIDGYGSPYKRADANLDGIVDGQDFILWNGGKFTSTLLWDVGDFNGDGVADGQDFILWNGNKFTSSDVVSVPEPGAATLSLIALILLGLARMRR